MALKEPQSGEMKHAVSSVERGIEYVRLKNIAANVEQPDARIAQRGRQILGPPTDKIVVHDDFANVFLEEPIDRVRSDQPGATDYDELCSFKSHGGGHKLAISQQIYCGDYENELGPSWSNHRALVNPESAMTSELNVVLRPRRLVEDDGSGAETVDGRRFAGR